MQRAWHEVSHLLPADQRGDALPPAVLHMEVATALIHTTFERYFLTIFWYALLGPAGLLLILGALAVRNHYPSAPVRAFPGVGGVAVMGAGLAVVVQLRDCR